MTSACTSEGLYPACFSRFTRVAPLLSRFQSCKTAINL
nr:MAG TPA: hypothetical protein [Caudoviricetes sp.]